MNLQQKQNEIQETQANEKLCLHCETPLRVNQESYCCIGCEFVHRSINSIGLGDFYNSKFRDVFIKADGIDPDKNFTYLDQPEFQCNIDIQKDGSARIDFYLPAIHCIACIWLLEKLPAVIPGLKSARVSYASAKAEFLYDSEKLKLSELAKVLNSLGYPPVPCTKDKLLEENKRIERDYLKRIGVAAVCAANTMMLAASLFQSYFTGMEEPYLSLFKYLSALITLPALIYSAMPFYRSAIGALMLGSFHIDLPISIAILVSYVAGVLNIINGKEYFYFDTITTLIFLILLSRYLQRRAVYRSRASSLTSWDFFPANVFVQEADRIIEKPARELQINDIVITHPGERVPADSIVIEGTSALDCSFLTGESLPRNVTSGDLVLGGTLNLEADLKIQVKEIAAKTRLGKIFTELEREQSKTSNYENEVNRLSVYFVAIVLILSALTFAFWFFYDASRAFDITISLLIITCPCALGMAIPAALTVALSNARSHGIFIRKPESLQQLLKAKNYYFDKTGTLTVGKFNVVKAELMEVPDSVIKAMASYTMFHPISRGIYEFYRTAENISLNKLKHYNSRGVSAELQDNTEISLGSLKWFIERGINIPSEIQNKINLFSINGETVILAEHAGNIIGIFALADQISPAAFEIVNLLRKLNKNIFILSGDSSATVMQVAKSLKIPESQAYASLYPEDKVEIIKKDPEINVIIGDGLNDGQAMLASTIGVGLRGGIEASMEVADIFISRGDLQGFLVALKGVANTQNVIRRNLIFSLFYNTIGAIAACSGYITPLIAAILMPISSLTVVLSSVWGRYFNTEKD